MEQTRLQKIVEQKANQIRNAIEEAIADGAKIEICRSNTYFLRCRKVDGVYLQQQSDDGTISVILNFSSEKIASVFEPSKDDLAKLAEQKRKELEEIERQIKERTNDETDRN